MTFDWNQARAFLATVEEGSLSAAARALGQTQPTLGRQVAALEADLGVVLFERVGRGYELTPTGADLAQHIRVMRDAANQVSLAATGRSQAIEGTVRITASDLFAVHLLPRVLAKLQKIAPRLQIDVVGENDISDLQRREADIAVRHVRPTQPELYARLIAEADGYFYASPEYLARRGTPTNLEALKSHDFVGFGDLDQMIGHLSAIGIDLTPENFRVTSENGNVAWEMVRQGFGIAPMSDRVAEHDRSVMRILPDVPPIKFPVWLTTHRELHSSARIRVVYDCLAAEFWPKA